MYEYVVTVLVGPRLIVCTCCTFIQGRVKFTLENRSGAPLDPSPNFDCHLLKTGNIDMSSMSPQYVYECTQVRPIQQNIVSIHPIHPCHQVSA